jgi:predicted Zn finger-like uncharacterized protein
MKFVCDKCQTQYMISDDKVGQKGVKVRCKRCGNTIALRSSNGHIEIVATNPSAVSRESQKSSDMTVPDGDELGQAFDQLVKDGSNLKPAGDTGERETEIVNLNELDRLRAQSNVASWEHEHEKIDRVFANFTDNSSQTDKPEVDKDWYIGIDNKQVGPLSISEISQKLKDKLIDLNCLAWRQGMDNWQSLQELPQFKQLIEMQSQSKEEASPESDTIASQSSLTALVEKELASVAGSIPAHQETEKKPQSILSSLVSEEVAPWERNEPASGSVAEKHENIFQTQPTGFNQVITNPNYMGGSARSNRKMIFGSAIVVLVLLVASAMVYAFRANSDNAPNVLAAGNISSASANQDSKPTVSGAPNLTSTNEAVKNTPKEPIIAPSEDPATKKEQATKVAETTVEKSTIQVPEVKENKGVTSSKDNPKKLEEKIAAASPKKPNQLVGIKEAPKTIAPPKHSAENNEDSKNLTNTLTNEQIKGVIRGKIEQMKNCVEQQQQRDPSVTGTMLISFIIENTGRVNTVNTLSEEHRGTFVSNCITYVIKAMKFPHFTGDPVEVPRLPLKLGG